MSDGVLTIPGLVIGAWGKIVVDVPVATFLVSGDVLLAGEGKIDNYSWPLPEDGPDICMISCGTIRLLDRSRIRSHGDRAGGTIFLCAGQDIVMERIAGTRVQRLRPPARSLRRDRST